MCERYVISATSWMYEAWFHSRIPKTEVECYIIVPYDPTRVKLSVVFIFADGCRRRYRSGWWISRSSWSSRRYEEQATTVISPSTTSNSSAAIQVQTSKKSMQIWAFTVSVPTNVTSVCPYHMCVAIKSCEYEVSYSSRSRKEGQKH